MDIDGIIKNVAADALKDNNGSVADAVGGEGVADGNMFGGSPEDKQADDILNLPVEQLYKYFASVNVHDDIIRTAIFKRFKADTKIYIDDFLLTCEDANADKGMYKCSLETWKACANYIGMEYFRTYKLNRDYRREGTEGGCRLYDDVIQIGLVLYEEYCNMYRKQFFIYDSCKFLGIDLDNMYMLSELHSVYLKKAHSIQEDSMRTALASGRSNVTAMAILLNHDYDYTRTTQVIHTSDAKQLTADRLPKLDTPQDIVIEDGSQKNQISIESM